LETKLIFRGGIFHFHDYGRKRRVLEGVGDLKIPSFKIVYQKQWHLRAQDVMGSLRKIVGENIGLEDELGGHWEIYPDGLSQVHCGKRDEGLRDPG